MSHHPNHSPIGGPVSIFFTKRRLASMASHRPSSPGRGVQRALPARTRARQDLHRRPVGGTVMRPSRRPPADRRRIAGRASIPCARHPRRLYFGRRHQRRHPRHSRFRLAVTVQLDPDMHADTCTQDELNDQLDRLGEGRADLSDSSRRTWRSSSRWSRRSAGRPATPSVPATSSAVRRCRLEAQARRDPLTRQSRVSIEHEFVGLRWSPQSYSAGTAPIDWPRLSSTVRSRPRRRPHRPRPIAIDWLP